MTFHNAVSQFQNLLAVFIAESTDHVYITSRLSDDSCETLRDATRDATQKEITSQTD